MTQVTIPPSLGGSGVSYSDDGTGARDMRNGGHRAWLLPMVGEQIAAAQAAATAAASTLGSANTQATSTTSLAIGTGARSLVVEAGKAFVVGMPVRIASAASPANRMDGTVTSYDSGTGALVVSVDRVSGSGTLASWRVFLTGAGISTADALGGAAVTTTAAGFALTAAASRVQSVSFTADAQSVTLPDATTLSLGGPLYVIRNAGSRTFGVRASGGALLTAVPPGGVAECYLDANGTAAGQWAVAGRDLQPALTICDATLASTLTQSVEVAVRLTDTLSLHFARNASGHPFVFAVDHSTFPATVGTAVLIVASNLTVEHAFRISNTKAMFKVDGTSSNVFNVTVSGTTCTVSSAATAAVFDQATFTGVPLICALGANNDLFVALDETGTTIRAQAIDASGANPSAGSSVNVSALGTGSVEAISLYRVTATTAVAFYIDDTGSAGTPFSIRGVVLSLSGTTITVGTPAGINDVINDIANNGGYTAQLSATSYVWGYGSGDNVRAVAISVTGTTVTFGAAITVDALAAPPVVSFGQFGANRFRPNLYALSATAAFFAFRDDASRARCAILTVSGTTISTGTVFLPGVFNSGFFLLGDAGGAIAGRTASTTELRTAGLVALAFSGATVSATGGVRPIGAPLTNFSSRFNLSGGALGVVYQSQGNTSLSAVVGSERLEVFRFVAGGPPRSLGAVTLPDMGWPSGIGGSRVPVELSPHRAAFTALSLSQPGATALVKLAILEFAA